MMSIPVNQDLTLISYCYYCHEGLPVAILPDQRNEGDDDQRTCQKLVVLIHILVFTSVIIYLGGVGVQLQNCRKF